MASRVETLRPVAVSGWQQPAASPTRATRPRATASGTTEWLAETRPRCASMASRTSVRSGSGSAVREARPRAGTAPPSLSSGGGDMTRPPPVGVLDGSARARAGRGPRPAGGGGEAPPGRPPAGLGGAERPGPGKWGGAGGGDHPAGDPFAAVGAGPDQGGGEPGAVGARRDGGAGHAAAGDDDVERARVAHVSTPPARSATGPYGNTRPSPRRISPGRRRGRGARGGRAGGSCRRSRSTARGAPTPWADTRRGP